MRYPLRTYVYTPPEARPRRDPSPQRAKVLAFIKSEIKAGRGFPDNRAITTHMGWTKTEYAARALADLAVDGRLSRRRLSHTHSVYEVIP